MEPIVFTIPPLGDDTTRSVLGKLSDDKRYVDSLVYMANGNPGAMNVIVAMHKVDPERASFGLGKCMAWEIRGPMLWLLYKDVCKQDAAETLKVIEMDDAPDKLEKLPYTKYHKPTRGEARDVR